MTVDDLKLNEIGLVKGFLDNDIPLKLVEMGCVIGSELVVVKRALFNDPVYLQVNVTHLAIRRELAVLIEVDRV